MSDEILQKLPKHLHHPAAIDLLAALGAATQRAERLVVVQKVLVALCFMSLAAIVAIKFGGGGNTYVKWFGITGGLFGLGAIIPGTIAQRLYARAGELRRKLEQFKAPAGENVFSLIVAPEIAVSARHIDVVQLYDAFTINTILFLEDLGFCAKGEGGPFVENGAIAPGGRLPVNTNGGGLSCVHPGMYGLFAMVEAVHQVRGTAGARQIAGAKLAIAHGNGGVLSSQATAIFGSEETL